MEIADTETPHIPLDNDGFTFSFVVDDEQGILDFWKKYGFVVVRDVLDQVNTFSKKNNAKKGTYQEYFRRDLDNTRKR
jgi:hypothetical protein